MFIVTEKELYLVTEKGAIKDGSGIGGGVSFPFKRRTRSNVKILVRKAWRECLHGIALPQSCKYFFVQESSVLCVV